MSLQVSPEIEQQVQRHVATGRYASADEVLRKALAALSAEEEDFEAVQDAITEWQAGDEGLPLEDAFALIRARHQRVAQP